MDKKEFYHDIGVKIKCMLIKSPNKSFRKMCEDLDISYSTWNQIVQNNRTCKVSFLKRVCNYFNITLVEFFSDLEISSNIDVDNDVEIETFLLKKIANRQNKPLALLIEEMRL
jgi:transcriptional regulator with XRE-family HTH domain